jgi:nucleotide-binding universal stress UspA family protein
MYQVAPNITPTVLIPWDGLTELGQIVAFARLLGGQAANLTLLPLTPGCTTEHVFDVDSVTGRSDCGAVHPPIEVLDLLDTSTDPAFEITAIADKRNIDLILMATPCHPAGKLDPSCLAAQLALDSPIPVMVVHVDCDKPESCMPTVTRLIISLDSSSRARQALPFAAELAQRLCLPVQLLMVLDPKQILPPAYAYDPDAAGDMVAGLQHDAHRALTEAERFLLDREVVVTSELLFGPVISCLETSVQPGDLLVMTTHGIGQASQGRLGSVAAALVANPPGPLVIMRSSLPPDIVAHPSLRTAAWVS